VVVITIRAIFAYDSRASNRSEEKVCKAQPNGVKWKEVSRADIKSKRVILLSLV
jgi:hypothetical protein